MTIKLACRATTFAVRHQMTNTDKYLTCMVAVISPQEPVSVDGIVHNRDSSAT